MKDKRRRPRWLQELWAWLNGYFWLPCPLCGEDFGGHEWAGTLELGGGHGKGVCPNCVESAKRRNEMGNPAYGREGMMWVLKPGASSKDYEWWKRLIEIERESDLFKARQKAEYDLWRLYLEYHEEVPGDPPSSEPTYPLRG